MRGTIECILFLMLINASLGEYTPHSYYFKPFNSLSKTFKTCNATSCEYECPFKTNKLCSFTGYGADGHHTTYEGCIWNYHKDKCCSLPDKADDWIYTENVLQFTCLHKNDRIIDTDGNEKTFEQIKDEDFCSDEKNAICRKPLPGGSEETGPFIHVCQQKTEPCNNKRYINKRRKSKKLETTTRKTTTDNKRYINISTTRKTTTATNNITTTPRITITEEALDLNNTVLIVSKNNNKLSLILIPCGSLGGVILIICLVLTILRLKKKKKAEATDELELENITQSLNISVLKNDALESTLQKIIDYHWKISTDFEEIEELSSRLDKTCRLAKRNRRHNRHRHPLPYDDNTITLDNKAGIPPTTYINASRLQFPDLDQIFISTQLPTTNTVQNFWELAFQEDVSVIVLLDSRKQIQFWPDKDQLEINEGAITVRYMSHSFTGNFYHRKLAMVGKGKIKAVDMIHIDKWEEDIIPRNTKELLNVLYQVQEIVEQKQGPILTVCQNGSDRSGIYIALHKLLDDYKNPAKDRLDVFGTVSQMREQRAEMIGRLEQYEFTLDCLQDFVVAQGVDYEMSGQPERRDRPPPTESIQNEKGCTCTKALIAMWDIGTSLWLIVDMSLDIHTTRRYHRRMMAGDLDEAYFIGSLIGHLAPILGIILLSWMYLAYVIRRPKTRHYVQTVLFTIISPFVWVLTPLFALITALLGVWGIDVLSEHPLNDSRGRFRRFVAFVMLTKGIEQLMEAVPQLIISAVYIDAHGISGNEITLLSCIASGGSFLFFIIKHVFDVANNFEKSIVGIIAADRVTFI